MEPDRSSRSRSRKHAEIRNASRQANVGHSAFWSKPPERDSRENRSTNTIAIAGSHAKLPVCLSANRKLSESPFGRQSSTGVISRLRSKPLSRVNERYGLFSTVTLESECLVFTGNY